MVAYKACRKSLGVEVSNAGFIVWEVFLKVWQSFGYKAALACFGHRDIPHSYSADHFAVYVASS